MSSIDFNEYFWQKKSDTTQGWTAKYLVQACHKLHLSKANLSWAIDSLKVENILFECFFF